jgi:hypothetical protein
VIKSRRIRYARHIARLGERRSAYRILVEKPEEKRPLVRSRRRWEDNTNMEP